VVEMADTVPDFSKGYKKWPVALRKDSTGEERMQEYEKNGCLVLEGLIDPAMCDRLKARAEAMIEERFDPSLREIFTTDPDSHSRSDYFIASAGNTSFFLDENVWDDNGQLKAAPQLCMNKIGHAMHDEDEMFSEFTRQPALKQLTADLGMTDPRLVQAMYIFKQPRGGGAVNIHQDATFLYSTPNTTVGYWIALEDATVENGCLWAIPAGHKTKTKSRWVRAERAGESGKVDMKFVGDRNCFSQEDMHALEVSKGSVVVIHGNLPHMSYANLSDRSRNAFTLHLFDAAQSTWDPRNWLQRDLSFRGFD